MSDAPVINELHTSCRHCCFAKWQGNLQVGCESDQLEKFKKANAEIIEVYDDNQKEFFVINNRLCKMSRTNTWKEKQVRQDIESLLKRAKDEITFKYQAVIYLIDLESLNKTLKSLSQQTVLPKQINIIRPFESSILPHKIVAHLKQTGIKWKIHNLIASDDFYSGVDIAVKEGTYPYYATFRSGFTIDDKDAFKKIESKVNNDLLQFGMIRGDLMDNMTIVNFPFHYLMRGNKGMLLKDKFVQEGIICPQISEILQ